MHKRALLSLMLVGVMSCSGSEGQGAQGAEEGNTEESEPKPKDSEGETSPEPDQEKDKELDCSKLASTGLDIGDVAPNLELEDGEGNKVQLHDYCNDNVILIASEY